LQDSEKQVLVSPDVLYWGEHENRLTKEYILTVILANPLAEGLNKPAETEEFVLGPADTTESGTEEGTRYERE
jgi:hypothetical protein